MHFICYMVPKAVLILLPTMHSKITSNANTTNNNNVSTPTVCNSGSTATISGVYQQTLFGLSKISIHMLVFDAISAGPYLKALLTKLFIHCILDLSNNPSLFFSDLITTATSYFSINTGFIERETESAA